MDQTWDLISWNRCQGCHCTYYCGLRHSEINIGVDGFGQGWGTEKDSKLVFSKVWAHTHSHTYIYIIIYRYKYIYNYIYISYMYDYVCVYTYILILIIIYHMCRNTEMHKLLGSQGRECQRSHWKVPDLALVRMEIQQASHTVHETYLPMYRKPGELVSNKITIPFFHHWDSFLPQPAPGSQVGVSKCFGMNRFWCWRQLGSCRKCWAHNSSCFLWSEHGCWRVPCSAKPQLFRFPCWFYEVIIWISLAQHWW